MSTEDTPESDDSEFSRTSPSSEADTEESSEEATDDGADSPSESDVSSRGRELFREAVDNLSREEMERGKYDGDRERRASLGDTLEDELEDVEPTSDSSDGEPIREGERPSPAKPPREQMEEALGELSGDEMRRRKFGDEHEGDEEARADLEDEEQRRNTAMPDGSAEQRDSEQTRRREEARRFREAMRDVDPAGDSNRHVPDPPKPESFADETADVSSSSTDFVTPTLAKEGEGLNRISPLDASQRAMRSRFRDWAEAWPVPELSVRGHTTEEALDQLESFVERCWCEGDRFARIIPGRGLRSEGPPVLKPTVLSWLEEEGADYIKGYIPERSIEGDYGSLVIEFEVSEDDSS